jgi:DNA-binding MarR family transcriptional regulator
MGITHAQASVLIMLSMGSCQTAADLARDMFIDAAATKRTLDKIVAKGWIQRVPDASDKRLFKLELTPAGQALAAEIPATFRSVLEVGFTGFSQEEIGFLKSLLRKLLANRPLLDAKAEAKSKK